MNPSWKTTLCGVLGGLCIGLSQIPELGPLWVKICALLGATFPNLGLMFARDNKVTSEQACAKILASTAPSASGPSAARIFGLAALLAGTLAFAGCKTTTPLEASAKLLASTVATVDAAMKAYADAVQIGAVNAASQTQARELYRNYQGAESIAEAAIVSAIKTGDTSALNKASAALVAAREPLLLFLSRLTEAPPPNP